MSVVPCRPTPPINSPLGPREGPMIAAAGALRRSPARPTHGSTLARRHGTGSPEAGKGRMSISLKVPGLVRRIPGHRPTRSPRRLRATCWRYAVPARRGPARMSDRTIGLRPRHDSSMVATANGGVRKSEVQSLSFSPFRVPCPIRGKLLPAHVGRAGMSISKNSCFKPKH
jgi:hypothetical protein